jgi:PAS domain S-box-containing protein
MAESVTRTLPAALEAVARVVRIDRMVVVEIRRRQRQAARTFIYFVWESPDAPTQIDFDTAIADSPHQAALADWLRPLRAGKAVIGHTRTSGGAVRELLTQLQVVSVLQIPIFVNGGYWGHIAFEDCHSEHDWTAAEINVLTILANVIGVAVTRERSSEALRRANTIVQNSPTILYRLRGEPALPMLYISQNVALLGHDREELIASPTLYRDYIHPEDRARVQQVMAGLLGKDAPPATIEFRMLTRSGESRWMENRLTPARDRMAVLARTDALTGLANRAAFSDRIRQAFAAAKAGAPAFVVLYLDLDGFKEMNDTRGHPVGDKLLQAVAARLRTIAGEADLVARLGGGRVRGPASGCGRSRIEQHPGGEHHHGPGRALSDRRQRGAHRRQRRHRDVLMGCRRGRYLPAGPSASGARPIRPAGRRTHGAPRPRQRARPAP